MHVRLEPRNRWLIELECPPGDGPVDVLIVDNLEPLTAE